MLHKEVKTSAIEAASFTEQNKMIFPDTINDLNVVANIKNIYKMHNLQTFKQLLKFQTAFYSTCL